MEVLRDAEGFLMNPDDWNEDIAFELAGEEEVELNERYWSILNFMRQYYYENSITPDVRHLVDYLESKNNYSKGEAKKLIFELFPYGYVKQACKIAGMRKPRTCSTG